MNMAANELVLGRSKFFHDRVEVNKFLDGMVRSKKWTFVFSRTRTNIM